MAKQPNDRQCSTHEPSGILLPAAAGNRVEQKVLLVTRLKRQQAAQRNPPDLSLAAITSSALVVEASQQLATNPNTAIRETGCSEYPACRTLITPLDTSSFSMLFILHFVFYKCSNADNLST
jgi:hypothetical protein